MSVRLRYWALAALLAVPVAIAAVVVVVALDDDDRPTGDAMPTAVSATEPTFGTLGQLVAASDAVVVGTVTDVGAGRAISDPADPDAGIRTRLVSVRVDDVLAGTAASTLVVEQEAALLDSTAIEVNGVPPFEIGQRGVYFLVAGNSDEFPYHALVGSQGRYDVVDGRLAAAAVDPLANELGTMTPAEMRAAVAEHR